MENDTFDFGLIGHGETAIEAKKELMETYQEISEMQKDVPDLDFEFKYDLNSFLI
jgi:hypothetical protein